MRFKVVVAVAALWAVEAVPAWAQEGAADGDRVETSAAASLAAPAAAEPAPVGPRPVERFPSAELTPRLPAAVAQEAAAAEEAAAPAVTVPQARRSTALMLVGGALLIAGLLIGDDAGTVVAITGAAIGAYGLYLFLL